MQGKFIVFEGLDGSGQTTQADLLAKRLKRDGHKVLLTKEPTNNLIGGLIRGALTHEWKSSNTVLQLLYAADRGHHLEREILPALDKGYIVISDRYYYSSIAFGSIDLEMAWMEKINAHYPKPDRAFYISVPPKIAIKRIHANRFGVELFEKERELTLVAKTYQKLVKKHNVFYEINGEEPIEVVHENIYKLCCDNIIKYCPLPEEKRTAFVS